MRYSLACVMTVAFGLLANSVAVAVDVNCTEPYESDCVNGDYYFSCELILCETNLDPDPDAYPVICPDDATEMLVQPDAKYHLGLQTIALPNRPGFFYWTNYQALCSMTRPCDEDANCRFYPGGFFCPANKSTDLWTANTDMFYVGVEGEECEVVEN